MVDYDQVRPHSGLENLTPSEFALRPNPVASDAAWVRGAGHHHRRGGWNPLGECGPATGDSAG
jgi:hypothetical protein